MNDDRTCQVPLVELLRSVPKDAREFVQIGEHEHRNIPYGRMCHDAADALDAANERIRALEAAPTSEEVGSFTRNLEALSRSFTDASLEAVGLRRSADLIRRLDRERQALSENGPQVVRDDGSQCSMRVWAQEQKAALAEARTLLTEWLDGMYDGQDYLRKVRLFMFGPLRKDAIAREGQTR